MEYRISNSYEKLPEKYLKTVEMFLKDKGRRYFGKAASGLANQLSDPRYKDFNINMKSIKAGINGEESTSKVLRAWIKDKPNVVLVDSIHLPIGKETDQEELDEEEGQVNSLGDTDHLLIIGNSLIIIDSKNWKERASYAFAESGEILRTKKSFAGNRPHIAQSKYLWKKFFEGIDINVEAYVCISNPNSIIVRDRAWWTIGVKDYKLVNQETLVHFLDKEYERQYKNVDFIHVDVVAQAIQGIQKPYNQHKALFPTFYKLTRI